MVKYANDFEPRSRVGANSLQKGIDFSFKYAEKLNDVWRAS